MENNMNLNDSRWLKHELEIICGIFDLVMLTVAEIAL